MSRLLSNDTTCFMFTSAVRPVRPEPTDPSRGQCRATCLHHPLSPLITSLPLPGSGGQRDLPSPPSLPFLAPSGVRRSSISQYTLYIMRIFYKNVIVSSASARVGARRPQGRTEGLNSERLPSQVSGGAERAAKLVPPSHGGGFSQLLNRDRSAAWWRGTFI